MKTISELNDTIEKKNRFLIINFTSGFYSWIKKETELEMVKGKMENVAHKILTTYVSIHSV